MAHLVTLHAIFKTVWPCWCATGMARTTSVSSLQNSASVSSLLFTFSVQDESDIVTPMKYCPLFSDLQSSNLSFWVVHSSSILAEFLKATYLRNVFYFIFLQLLMVMMMMSLFVGFFKILILGTEPSYNTATENIPVHPGGQIDLQLSDLGAGVAKHLILSRSLLWKLLTYELFWVLVMERELLIKR